MEFSIYNPDKKIITEFTKCELAFFANSMFIITHTRNVFDIMITVTQIDIALYSVISTGCASIIATWFLISEKEFKPNYEKINEQPINIVTK